jgi:hypothetical protein
MAARALGAILAVIAALAFTGSLVSGVASGALPGWWQGHPRVDGKVIERKELRAGVLGATGCNLGEETTCKDELDVGSTTQMVGIGELAATGLADLFAILLAISVWRVGDRRKGVAKLAIVTSLLVAVGAGLLAALGPDIQAKQHVDVPIGLGLMLAWGGVGACALAGLLTMRVQPEPLRLKPSLGPQEPPVDVREILRAQPDSLRPSTLGPEPMIGASPFAPPPAPLVQGAPQLRPLYDVQGAAPVPAAPVLPLRAPTPLPRASIRAIAGIETPPPTKTGTPAFALHAPAPGDGRPETQPIEPPAPPKLRVPTVPDEPLRPKTTPPSQPAPRGSQPVVPRPASRDSQPSVPRAQKPSQPPARPPQRPSQPPPQIGRKTPPQGDRPIPLDERKQAGGAGVLPRGIDERKRVAGGADGGAGVLPRGTEKKTLAHAVPPPPTADTQPPPSKLSANDTRGLRSDTGPRLESETETNAREPDFVTAVEVDAEAKAAFIAKQAAELAERERHAAETAQMIEGSDTGVELVTSGQMPVDISTAEERALAMDERAAPRQELGDVVSSDTDVSTKRPDSEAERRTAIRPAISTAPPSLPPPKKTVEMPSGPTPACPQCEAPMAWVEEHLRFYCKQCKMYF